MTNEQRQWHREKCAEFLADHLAYQTYARVLEQILKAVCRIHAPMGIVQVRPKSFASYAEKMARKAQKYMALGIGPTDLCGARVITETQAEADHICAVIREHFEIDEQNSLDASSRLTTGEFGYRSFHYVVQLKQAEIFGVAIPPEIGERKAEIQVRTLLQHAHASIGHDRVYKTSLKVQDTLKRNLARVAALLEEGDEAFGTCVRELDAFKLHYGAYMTRERLDEETAILELVLTSEPDVTQRPILALRLAQVARATGDYARIAALLTPFLGAAGRSEAEVLAEHGHALCRLHEDRPRSSEFQAGCAEIERAVAVATDGLKARVLGYRAWGQSKLPNNETKARDAYRVALDADPTNPFHLVSFVEYEMFLGEKLGLRSALAPTFTRAIRTCRDYIDAGIEVPWSFFTMGRLQLLLDQPYASLTAYTRAIRLCLEQGSTVPPSAVEAEVTFVRRITRGQEMPETHAWIYHLLLIAHAVRSGERPGDLTARRPAFTRPVVIMAGGTARAHQGKVDRLRSVVLAAFAGFRGTIISGGTNAGVAGLTGDLAATLGATKKGPVEVVGYIPRHLPYDQPADTRYTEVVPSDGGSYGAVHALQYWTDLVLAGVNPRDVRVLGIDGGPIAAFEYRVALALGASLGILDPASREAAALVGDPDWCDSLTLLRLPEDPCSLQAFLQPPAPALTEAQLEKTAQKIHAAYREEQHYQNPDPGMQSWERLDEGFRHSNRMQAAAATGFLERAGFRIEQATGDLELLVLTETEIEVLAQMEHGRWVVERLQQGWRYEDLPKRDVNRKRHPDLVAWNKLPDSVKEWDRRAVRNWPKLLAEAGLAVRRPDDGTPR